jgi:hypothetical protein
VFVAPTIPAPVVEPASSAHEDKLYLLIRQDLSVGYQLAQSSHAVADFCFAHPDLAARWHALSNSLIVLSVPDERTLHEVAGRARARGIAVTSFREPDLADELTAVAVAPGAATRKLCSNFPLAGRQLSEQAPLLARERRLREMSYAMRDCEQTPGQDVLAHGRSVREHYLALAAHLRGELDLAEAGNWRLPDWVGAYRQQLLSASVDSFTMERYLTLHDAGKPAVRELDGAGRQHFPGHAKASRVTYEDAYGDDADPVVADLIEHDLDVHLLKADGVAAFAAGPHAVAHLLAGLAEVTSNAAMFGGVDSTGFRIKYKALDKRGRALCRLLFDEGATTGQRPTTG